MVRDVVKSLNKHSLSNATGISYSKLRKFAAGAVDTLTPDEYEMIMVYLYELIDICKETNSRGDLNNGTRRMETSPRMPKIRGI